MEGEGWGPLPVSSGSIQVSTMKSAVVVRTSAVPLPLYAKPLQSEGALGDRHVVRLDLLERRRVVAKTAAQQPPAVHHVESKRQEHQPCEWRHMFSHQAHHISLEKRVLTLDTPPSGTTLPRNGVQRPRTDES